MNLATPLYNESQLSLYNLEHSFSIKPYELVSVDEVAGGDNPLELYVRNNVREAERRGGFVPPLEAWNYSACHKGCEHQSVGSRDLPDMLTNLLKDVIVPYEPFSGLVLHTYPLRDYERDQIAATLGIKKVAYLEEQPPPAEPKPGSTRTIDMGGMLITMGGGRGKGLSISM